MSKTISDKIITIGKISTKTIELGKLIKKEKNNYNHLNRIRLSRIEDHLDSIILIIQKIYDDNDSGLI
ncbi:hypothetical protein EKK58_07325 [Candidatus Dependentiae bacterium]|nr:MAG: hypothetical protein EKK58_07325 [Candidatus Dependentiae bacterium]